MRLDKVLPNEEIDLLLVRVGGRRNCKGVQVDIYNHEMITQKQKRKIFLAHWDMNFGPLEPKASVLPMRYTDHNDSQTDMDISDFALWLVGTSGQR